MKCKNSWATKLTIFFFAASFLSCCASAGPTEPGPTAPSSSRSSIGVVWVDGRNGNDVIGSGTQLQPFKTLSHALSIAKSNITIFVKAGIYDSALGEHFPITVGNGVKLIADNYKTDTFERSAIIVGSGEFLSTIFDHTYQAAIILEDSAIIEGFAITAPTGVAIWSESEAQAIRDNVIMDSNNGIVLVGTNKSSIFRNTIQETEVGVEMFMCASPILRSNVIQSNKIGVSAHDDSTPDLGRIADQGLNIFNKNILCDVANDTRKLLYADGNIWDVSSAVVKYSTSCSSGVNVANTNGGAISLSDIPSTETPLFPTASAITLLSPISNGTETATPKFAWEPTGDRWVMAGVFTEPIQVVNGVIHNTDALVWAWHSALTRGHDGEVAFNEGIPVHQGQLDVGRLENLQWGHAYYWAVWSWDLDGINIIHASPQHIFAVGIK
jgi:parallel beta-helix repeat protein